MASMAVQEGEDGDELVSSKAIFSSYVCRSLDVSFSGEPKPLEHPGDIAESTSLSSVLLPPSTYPLRDALPPELIQRGVLSNLQLEGVLYAATKHQQILPNGMRAGFFIGDGAGVGKGRQIAACILDNYVRGRRKHAWLSISSDLCLDARRDFADLGANVTVINNVQALDKTSYKSGVLFLTYSSLISHVGTRTRLDQVIEWLGGSTFDGCLVFDEAHKAKNHRPGKEGQSTKVSIAVLELQQRLPNARVLYCSATGVSEVGHMAYMTRMGLWGPGTAFKDFDAFLDAMKKRGVSFLEMLAMELKAEGKYVARGLSFRDAEFTELEAVLTPHRVQLYDKAAALWRDLLAGLNSALSLTGNDKRDVFKLYWSAQQRFFKLLCVSLKVPTVVAEAKAALDAGCAVVIGLQTTGEAADASMGLEPGPVPGFVSTTKELLVRFVKDHFPTLRVDKPADKNGAAAVGGVGPPVPIPECVAVRAELLELINELPLPPNFLDHIIDELGGPTQVAEMTGRKGRVVRIGGRFRYEIRAKPDSNDMDSLNVHEKELFMSGQRFVAIISDAASTGISLHASRTAKNQRRRVHLTIELPWSADKAIQQLGRSHRSNQVCGPIYKLISTTVGGEKRFAAAVARRLESLGALTRGDRRAASGIDLSEQNFDSPLGRRSLRRMYDAIATQSSHLPTGVSLAAILRETIKAESGRPDMTDAEAEALADIQDTAMRTTAILELHEQLRAYTDVMGVGASAPRNAYDTTAENLDLAAASGGLGAASAAALAGVEGKGGAAAKELGDVKRFLNRLLGLPVAHQNLLFAYFSAVLAAEVEDAKKKGTYSEGLSDLHSSRITSSGPAKLVWEDPLSGLRTWRHDFTIDRGLSYEDAVAKLEHEVGPAALQLQAKEGQPASPAAAAKAVAAAAAAQHGHDMVDDQSGFRRSRRPLYGQHMVLLVLRKPGSRNLYTVFRPNTGQSILDIERSELDTRYTRISPQDAAEEWHAAYTAALTQCLHGKECKQGALCNVGKRLAPVTVLSGSVVRVWGVLESVLARHEAELTRAERIVRVVRVELPHAAGNPFSHAAPAAQGPAGAAAARAASMLQPQQAAERVCILSGNEEDSELEIVDDSSPNNNPSSVQEQGQCEHVSTPVRSKVLEQQGSGSNLVPAAGDGVADGTGSRLQASDSEVLAKVSAVATAPAAVVAASPGSSKKGRQSAPSTPVPADHIVGVRYPSALLPEVVAMLHGGAVQSLQSVAAESPAGTSRTYLRDEPPLPVQKQLRVNVFQPPKLIDHYFKTAPAGQQSQPVAAAQPSLPALPRRSSEQGVQLHQRERESVDLSQDNEIPDDGVVAVLKAGPIASQLAPHPKQQQQQAGGGPSQPAKQLGSKVFAAATAMAGNGKVHLTGPSAIRGRKAGQIPATRYGGHGLSSWLLKGPAANTVAVSAKVKQEPVQTQHKDGASLHKATDDRHVVFAGAQQRSQHAVACSNGMQRSQPIHVIVLDSDDSNPPSEGLAGSAKTGSNCSLQPGAAVASNNKVATVAASLSMKQQHAVAGGAAVASAGIEMKRALDMPHSVQGDTQAKDLSSSKRRRLLSGLVPLPVSGSPSQGPVDVIALDDSPASMSKHEARQHTNVLQQCSHPTTVLDYKATSSSQEDFHNASGCQAEQLHSASHEDMQVEQAEAICAQPQAQDGHPRHSQEGGSSSPLQELVSMGFSDAQARRALCLAHGDARRAVEICLEGAM